LGRYYQIEFNPYSTIGKDSKRSRDPFLTAISKNDSSDLCYTSIPTEAGYQLSVSVRFPTGLLSMWNLSPLLAGVAPDGTRSNGSLRNQNIGKVQELLLGD
jgi:hypothetical protein